MSLPDIKDAGYQGFSGIGTSLTPDEYLRDIMSSGEDMRSLLYNAIANPYMPEPTSSTLGPYEETLEDADSDLDITDVFEADTEEDKSSWWDSLIPAGLDMGMWGSILSRNPYLAAATIAGGGFKGIDDYHKGKDTTAGNVVRWIKGGPLQKVWDTATSDLEGKPLRTDNLGVLKYSPSNPLASANLVKDMKKRVEDKGVAEALLGPLGKKENLPGVSKSGPTPPIGLGVSTKLAKWILGD